MNEWYQPVYNYKSEQNLTWPQLAARWGMSERELRRKDHPPSAKVVAKIRESLPKGYIPASLMAQADIFTDQQRRKLSVQVLA